MANTLENQLITKLLHLVEVKDNILKSLLDYRIEPNEKNYNRYMSYIEEEENLSNSIINLKNALNIID